MTDKIGPSRKAKAAKRASRGPRRLTDAETIKRQKAIAYARDVERLTWAAIAERMKMGEKEARESHRRYLSDIVPLLIAEPAEGKAAELLRDLDAIRQQQLEIARLGEHESARVGALRDASKSIQTEFEIRRSLGLMPAISGDDELSAIARQIADVLQRHGVADEAIDEIGTLLSRGEPGRAAS